MTEQAGKLQESFFDPELDVWDPVPPPVEPGEDGSWGELSAEQSRIRAQAREVAERELRPWARYWDENEEFPARSLSAVRETGLLGLCVPAEYGGRGMGLFEGCLVVEELARACLSSAMAVQPFLNGPWRAVYVLGDDEQRRRLLPGVADGTRHFAIAMSEPGAGTAGTDLRAELRPDGSGFRLHGVKSWVTGGREADTTIVFCRAPGTVGPYGIGAVLIEGRPEGMAEPHVDPKMGIRGVAECTLRFDGVRIEPEDVLVMPEAGAKKGAEILVNQFNPERCGNAAMCTGLAQAALEASVGHLKARRQFDRPLADFQGLQWMVADMSLDVEVSRMLVWRAARANTSGFPPQRETVMAKLYSSEMVQRVTNQAIQIHGARGYSRRWPVERLFRDGRGLAMGGGTAEVMRNMLAAIALERRVSQRVPTS
ncbi:acyl-CoA dehydrogenase family protein [Actinomadura sp. DC4]|uniref:acyl-CoA dehydrogenase family protein n=1 Tax=Actinomadura sp. DC4 TaxID=3055069 RepID=UPI0025AFE21F|nr:acyl-CoA dehydrogenase family protein [Actinomadura sp. DC4]MDN3356355.1 acyl-CoA dehydrogenase family protein [Actinomadura sp. DC4]